MWSVSLCILLASIAGKVSQWKDRFTAEQNEYFDKLFEEKMKDCLLVKDYRPEGETTHWTTIWCGSSSLLVEQNEPKLNSMKKVCFENITRQHIFHYCSYLKTTTWRLSVTFMWKWLFCTYSNPVAIWEEDGQGSCPRNVFARPKIEEFLFALVCFNI